MTKRILPMILILLLLLQTTACAVGAPLPEGTTEQTAGFTDVPSGAVYAEAVAWCRENNIMNGVTDTSFAPESTLTRSMLATALYRAEQEPAVNGEPAFSDTQAGSWYAGAVVWADSAGIMRGYGNGLFGTDDAVTREQLAAILWRHGGGQAAGQAGIADRAAVSGFAVAAVDWAVETGVMAARRDTSFLPRESATRAEVAMALHAYLTDEMLPEKADTGDTNVLVVYFSATNNTRGIAEKIAEAVGGDLFAIEAQAPYTAEDRNYNDPASRAQIEQNDDTARPEITGTAANLDDYSVVFLGYPIWNGKAPKVIYTFLENSGDWSGKTIVPFCTSGSSPLGSSAESLHALISSEANWLEGNRFSASASQETVDSWVNTLHLSTGREFTPEPRPPAREGGRLPGED